MRGLVVLVLLGGCSFGAGIGYHADYATVPRPCDPLSGAMTADIVGAGVTGGLGGLLMIAAATSSGDSADGVAALGMGAIFGGVALLETIAAFYGHHAHESCVAGERAFQRERAGGDAGSGATAPAP